MFQSGSNNYFGHGSPVACEIVQLLNVLYRLGFSSHWVQSAIRLTGNYDQSDFSYTREWWEIPDVLEACNHAVLEVYLSQTSQSGALAVSLNSPLSHLVPWGFGVEAP